MVAIPIGIYALLCLLVAFRGRHTQLGFLGTLIASVFLTPILVFLAVVLLSPHPSDVARQ